MILGIDIGGTHIKYAMVSSPGTILGEVHSLSVPHLCSSSQMIDSLNEIILSMKERSSFHQVGIALPGQVDSNRNRSLGGCYNLPCLADIDWEANIAQKYQLDLHMDNDANCAALAEWVYRKEPYANFLVITLGTGIGGGLILNKELTRGEYFYGGEVGHMSIDPNGRLCTCSLRGCIEIYASANAIIQDCQALFPDQSMEYQSLAKKGLQAVLNILEQDADKEKARDVRAILDQAASYLGFLCANINNLLNLGGIAFGGGGSYLPEFFFHTIRNVFHSHSLPLNRDKCEIGPTFLKNNAGLIGAAFLFRKG